MTGIAKRFPGVVALNDVALEVRPGEVHGLIGENGAGKSTLLKILSGAQAPDAGEIVFDGAPVVFAAPYQAQAKGIVTIYQEFNLIPTLSVAENVMIGREPGRGGLVNWPAVMREAKRALDRPGPKMDPRPLGRDLSVADQQMVEIARALSIDARLIIMDEPTAALSAAEVARLLDLVRSLKTHDIGVIYVTHRLDEVMAVCDRATVLRDGQLVGTVETAETDVNGLIRMMVGRELGVFAPVAAHGARSAAPLLSVDKLGTDTGAFDPNATTVHDISLDVYGGEILGVAGLVGAGRTELARAIFGADPKSS